jgi:transposase
MSNKVGTIKEIQLEINNKIQYTYICCEKCGTPFKEKKEMIDEYILISRELKYGFAKNANLCDNCDLQSSKMNTDSYKFINGLIKFKEYSQNA